MGQKVNPHGMRVGIIKDWDTKWYAEKDYAKLLIEDTKIRRFLKKHLFNAGISRIEIERTLKRIKLTIYAAKPGMVIGRGGAGIEDIKKAMSRFTTQEVDVNIKEVKSAELDATLVAENIASQLERRIAFRRAMKQAVGRTMRFGAKGIKVLLGGRLGGAEIARSEGYHEGSIPLHTLRANIDYGVATAQTTYGAIGVKVWIYKGEIMPGEMVNKDENVRENRGGKERRTGDRRNNRRGHRGGRNERGERRDNDRQPNNAERSEA